MKLDRSLRVQIIGWISTIAFTLVVYLGLVHQINGAVNVAMFFVWAYMLPGSFLLSMKKPQENLAKYPSDISGARWLVKLFPLGCFVWFGYWFTAIALAVALVAIHVAVQTSRELAVEK